MGDSGIVVLIARDRKNKQQLHRAADEAGGRAPYNGDKETN